MNGFFHKDMIRDRLQKNYVVRATVTELGITTTEMFKFHIVQFLPLSLLGICFLSALFMFSYSVQWNKSSISRLSRRWQEKKKYLRCNCVSSYTKPTRGVPHPHTAVLSGCNLLIEQRKKSSPNAVAMQIIVKPFQGRPSSPRQCVVRY